MGKQSSITFWANAEHKAIIKKKAKAENRSVSNWIKCKLLEEVK